MTNKTYKSRKRNPIRGLLIATTALILPQILGINLWAVPFEGQKMLMTGPSPLATKNGRSIAEKGGNAVDVAITMALTLSVTSPYYAAFGGGGFALVRQAPNNEKKVSVDVLDFREVAPAATAADYYVRLAPEASQDGGAAVGVPGIAAGLWALHQKHGRLPWKTLFTQVIPLAEKGFQVSGEWSELTQKNSKRFNDSGKAIFLGKDGQAPPPGRMLRQPALAKFLRLYRQRGDKAFYSGKVAKDIAETVQATGGVITEKDLSAYKVRWLQPLSVDFQGHRLHLMPPPSSGGIVIGSALKLIDYSALKKLKPQSVEELHLLAEILKISFRGRNLLGDPQFHSNPLAHLISGEYLEPLAKQLSPKKRLKLEPLADVHGSKESTETTHLSVLDIEGNAVAMTVTLNGNYGSGVVSKKYGISLNNEMDDFTTRPGEPNMFGLVQGKANQVEAGKRPLSSMSPTLVEKDGRIVMSLGAPGGPRIISGVIQVLYRTLVNGWNMDIAIQAPRVHHQFLPDQLYFDEFRLQPATQSGLQALGHSLQASSIARVYGIQLNKKGWLEAAFDSRGEGSVDGF